MRRVEAPHPALATTEEAPPAMDSKTCIGCGGTWPVSFFHLNGGTHKKSRYQPRAQCMGCARKYRSPNHVFLRKATTSTILHARNFAITRAEFIDRFGWNRERLADDLRHALGGTCPYCQNPYTELQQLTFDVIDPQRPPNYSANVRICCRTCNSAKKQMNPEAWAVRIKTWEEYRKWIEAVKSNPQLGLPLFQNA